MKKLITVLAAAALSVGGCGYGKTWTWDADRAMQFHQQWQSNVEIPKMQYDIQTMKQQQFFDSMHR